jgi:hypothetical protein
LAAYLNKRALSGEPNLQHLDLSGTFITSKALDLICVSLITHKENSLQSLALDRLNNLSLDSVINLGRMLENNKSLQMLDLSRNYSAMSNGSIVIISRLEKNSTLKTLKINNIVANECTYISIVKLVEVSTGLESIEM